MGNTPVQTGRFSLSKQAQLLGSDKRAHAESLTQQKKGEERSPSVTDHSFSPLRKAVLSSEKKRRKKPENNGEVHKQHLVQTFSALKVIPQLQPFQEAYAQKPPVFIPAP